MLIEFIRVDSGSTTATIHRRDGVVVALHGYDKKFRIPHDLAHAVAERELGLADGVFGSIAGGAVFTGMTVVSGKPRHDAAARSRRLLDANSKALTRAEVMAGVVHDAAEHPTGGSPGENGGSPGEKGRIDWGIVHPEPFPWSDEQLSGAVETLKVVAAQWDGVGRLEFHWPDRLTSAVPQGANVQRGRSGRR
jgi:hypothetical protein